MINLTIVQKPIKVTYTCDHCDEDVEIEFEDFKNKNGQVHLWEGKAIACPLCGYNSVVEDVEWD